MNFDSMKTAVCVVPPAPVVDARCLDSAYNLAHPDLCSAVPALILKPATAILCHLDSVQFRLFEYQGGVETEITTGATFSSSDPDALAIGVNSGNATAIGGGTVVVTATYGGKSVTAQIVAMPGVNCCDDLRVLTAIVVDNSRSMTLGFGGGYATRLTFAKAVASSYGGNIISVSGSPKDADSIWSQNQTITNELDFSDDTTAILDAIEAIEQTQQKTDLLDVFDEAAQDLLDNEADRRLLFLISDGEHTDTTNSRQSVLDAATLFKQAGGVVIVIGIRASAAGYDLLERLATGGFFINATSDNTDAVLLKLNYLKNLLCAGNCVPPGDTYVNLPELNYSSFQHWEVVSGIVDLLGPGLLDVLPGNGLYVRLNASVDTSIRTIDTFEITSGHTYRVSLDVAGNQLNNVTGGAFKVELLNGGMLTLMIGGASVAWDQQFTRFSFSFTAIADDTARIHITQKIGSDGFARLIDRVQFDDTTTQTNLLTDEFDGENLTYVPPACGASAGLSEIPNPDAPSVEFSGDFSDVLLIPYKYTYGISYVTNEGETATSTVVFERSQVAYEQTTRSVTIPQPDNARVTSIRLWRSLGEELDSDDSDTLFLMAELPVGQTVYLDSESHDAFVTRHDDSVEAPTENNTAFQSGLYYGSASCCYYEVTPGDEIELGPTMESNTTPEGVVSSGTALTFEVDWWLAFNGILSDTWAGDPGGGTPADTEWLQYQFPEAKTVSKYRIASHTILPDQGAPTGWTVEGSNNGAVWTLIDTQTGITTWEDNVYQTFSITTPGSYSYYRFTFTTATGNTSFSVSDIQFLSGGAGAFEYVNNCVECDATLGIQLPDDMPLPDIESGFNPPVVFTATKQYRATCGDDGVNIGTKDGPSTTATDYNGTLENILTLTTPSRLVKYTLAAPGGTDDDLVAHDWKVYGSTNGTTWTEIDSQTGIAWYSGEIKSFLIESATVFTHVKIVISVWEATVFPLTANTVIPFAVYKYPDQFADATESATSTVSQQDADNKALAAAIESATDLLNCAAVYTATENFTATCATGFGSDVTRSATRRSLISLAHAQQMAAAAAQAEAQSLLSCEGSNNTQRITINDRTGLTPMPASPYPSVQFVSGKIGLVTKVTVTLDRCNHGNYADIAALLVSPDGTGVYLMGNCMNAAFDSTERIFIIDDDAASSFPANSRPAGVTHTYKPTIFVGQIAPFPTPAPPPVGAFYETTLASLIGETPNGAWSLYIVDDTATNAGYVLFGWSVAVTSA